MAKYFITGGGTGGHIYPAIAVADGLSELGDEIFYVGNPKNLEYSIVNSKNYKFLGVNVHGMPRKASFALVKWLIELLVAIFKACYYIMKYRPDAVFGTGGYVSAPALIAAKFLKVPYMMHDCDANPGLVTRKLAPSAKCVSVAFDCACEVLNNKNCVVNGNPIRKEFKILTKEEARTRLGLENQLTLCVMGGSQGAKSINESTVRILKKLDMQIIFQTGKKNYDSVCEQLENLYPEYKDNKKLIVKPYFDDMVSVLKASDIAVSRSGSLSISEICASGIAPIFVPYPFAAADHQRKNAKFMVEKGAGIYIEDSEINEEVLFNAINSAKDNLAELQEKSLSLAIFDGVDRIVEQLKNL